MHKTALALFLIPIALACGKPGVPVSPLATREGLQASRPAGECRGLSEIRWETRGDGHLRFRLRYADEARFSISSIIHDGNKPHADLSLERESSPELFAFLEALFRGELEAEETPMSDLPAPSHTYLTFVDTCGTSERKHAPVVNTAAGKRDFSDLSVFVRERIKPTT